ncbi:hypothetical protein ACQ859_20690 [Roseateles chitinivorans]|uniref:hypothetical protein n=1 Tax=Roseateles chitinivorans TaxID=2917965 RepID=UPI003D667F0C
MFSLKHKNAAVLAAVSVLVAACGGGGSDAGTPLVATSTNSSGNTSTNNTSNNASPSTPAKVDAPVIRTQPANAAVLTDATATFSVVATGTGLAYQWKKNGAVIAGATSASYQTPAATYTDNGAQYSVVVTNAGGSSISSAAQLTLKAGPNQQAFEQLILTPSAGSYQLHWNLNPTGAQTSGIHFVTSDFAVLAVSPLTNGPQTNAQSAAHNLTTTLALPTASSPTRVLRNGAVVVVGPTSKVSYLGGDVRVDTLAADGVTVAFSEIRSKYETVALTGTIASTPADFAHFHNAIYSNAGVLDAAATYATGASYIKFEQNNKVDRYNVFDCTTATAGVAVTPCRVNTTLADAMTAGIQSNSDGTTYRLADGAIRTVDGVSIWVAANARPTSATLSATVQYRIYFELNGNVYTGALIKDGTLLGNGSYVSNPSGATLVDRLTFLTYDIRMNKAAHDSIAAAMKI